MRKLLWAPLALLSAQLGWAQPAIGGNTPAYHPQHVTGPDAGTDTCPV